MTNLPPLFVEGEPLCMLRYIPYIPKRGVRVVVPLVLVKSLNIIKESLQIAQVKNIQYIRMAIAFGLSFELQSSYFFTRW
jgi:hypothetical protein